MSANHNLTGYTKIVNDIPKYILGVIVIAVILEFSPNQNILDKFFIPQSKVKITTEFKDFKISRVIDGDTIEIKNNTEKIKVRLIGVNTPETVDPRKEVECFGLEASMYVKNFEGDSIKIELDSSQSVYDKYNRLLAYVYLSDGQMLNRKLVADGYAYEYTYSNPYKYQKEFKDIEKFAKKEGRGLWSVNMCNGSK